MAIGMTSQEILLGQYLALHQILPNRVSVWLHHNLVKRHLGKYGPPSMAIGMIFNDHFSHKAFLGTFGICSHQHKFLNINYYPCFKDGIRNN
jgi:hypothetical protein